MKRIITLFLAGAVVISAHAQLKDGKKNIDKLCGCFNVEFKYAETFSPDDNYKFHEREDLGAKELALPIENTDKKVVIQHLLVMGDSMVIKHWREDWIYEQPYLWVYQGDKKWTKQMLKPEQYKGKWTQTVWEVDDSPRYQGMSEWITTDGKTSWENTTNAPLPRREYTVRNDYNILKRDNRLVLTDKGYTHVQDNDKIQTSTSQSKLIAQEKGLNIYSKAPEQECAYAKTWWTDHSEFWSQIRTAWQDVLQSGSAVKLQTKVDNKFLFEHLDVLEQKYENKELKLAAVYPEAKTLIGKFATTSSELAMSKTQ